MNKFTSIVMDEIIVNCWNNVWYILQPCNEKLSWMIELWMKTHLVSENNCNIVNIKSQLFLTRNNK